MKDEGGIMTEIHEAGNREKAIESGFRALFRSVNLFGCEATLDLMVRLAHKDPVMNQLLYLFPGTVVMRDFLSRIPVIRVANPKNLKTRKKAWQREVMTQNDNQGCTFNGRALK